MILIKLIKIFSLSFLEKRRANIFQNNKVKKIKITGTKTKTDCEGWSYEKSDLWQSGKTERNDFTATCTRTFSSLCEWQEIYDPLYDRITGGAASKHLATDVVWRICANCRRYTYTLNRNTAFTFSYIAAAWKSAWKGNNMSQEATLRNENASLILYFRSAIRVVTQFYNIHILFINILRLTYNTLV